METSIIFITAAFFSFFISYLLASFEIYPFFRFFYVFAWYSYIFFIDGINYLIKNDSLIISRTKEFVYMLFVSCGMWFFFEIFNVSLSSWEYSLVPFDVTERYIFYLLLFSSILPAIFETEELIESSGLFRKVRININLKFNEKHIRRYIIFGIFIALLSISLPSIFFPLIWISLVFIFEPLNYKLGTRSLIRESLKGRIEKLLSISLAGVIYGMLWDIWGIKAGTKLIYTLPYLNLFKIFNTPVLSYIFFILFALGSYSMYNAFSYFKRGISWEYDSQTQISDIKRYKYFYPIVLIIIVVVFFIAVRLIDKYTVRLFTLI
ncbi:MAG: hypothetical protein KA059_04105 [Elusimicrobiales bacterium]|jgi:hypothetical protein|nr:hypothetical protein [Elusimicrobiales bacterium]